jgi:hypothetical protein
MKLGIFLSWQEAGITLKAMFLGVISLFNFCVLSGYFNSGALTLHAGALVCISDL